MDKSDKPQSDTQRILARASYEAPQGVVPIKGKRVGIMLQPTDDGHYRWFHDDGSPTIAEGADPKAAHRAAWFAWHNRDLQVTDGAIDD